MPTRPTSTEVHKSGSADWKRYATRSTDQLPGKSTAGTRCSVAVPLPARSSTTSPPSSLSGAGCRNWPVIVNGPVSVASGGSVTSPSNWTAAELLPVTGLMS